MPKPTMDPEKIHELLTRGVAEVYPSREALEAVLKSGRQLKIYNGIDPTAATLHIGHLASLQKLRQFQELGHEVIMLIGDFTGMIGDPTGKHSTRRQLTRKDVLANAKAYREQASSVLAFTGKNPTKIKRNGSWWDKMPALRFLELLSLTTAQRLLERDMFQERLKKGEPIGAHELLYPALQGYDSVAMNVDVEIGGTDQTFNMLMGRDYVRKMQNREKFVITVPLLADASGKKIGKSEGNMVELGADPENLFGQAMALPDGVIIACFEQCTTFAWSSIRKIAEELKDGGNPRDAKMLLAEEFVRMRYGAKDAVNAREVFVRTFREHEVPVDVPTVRVGRQRAQLVDLLATVKLVASKSEARRAIEQGGVKVDGIVTSDVTTEVTISQQGILLQKGKRHFVRVVP